MNLKSTTITDSLHINVSSHMKKRKRADLEEDQKGFNSSESRPLIWLKPHSKSKEGDMPTSSNNTSVIFGNSNLTHLTADDTFALPYSDQKSPQDVHILSCSLLNMTFGEQQPLDHDDEE